MDRHIRIWEGLSSKEFFDKLREGNVYYFPDQSDEAREALEPYLKKEKIFLSFIFIWIEEHATV